MSKPVRHSSHILETQSRKYFEQQLPDEWSFNTPYPDYGIDYHVDIVIKNQLTGLNFSVQVKSTKHSSDPKHAKVTLKRSTLNYYSVRLEPVLIIRYDAQAKEAYWVWFHHLEMPEKTGTKTCTINISKTNMLSGLNWQDVTVEVQHIFNSRSLISDFDLSKLKDVDIIAWSSYYREDHEKAIFLFKELLKNTADLKVQNALAWSYYKIKQYQEALETVVALEVISKTEQVFLLKACILAEFGIAQNDKNKILLAKNLFEQHIASNDSALMYYNYGNTLLGLQDSQQAIVAYQASLTKNPRHAECWKNMGSAYHNIGDYIQEIACYDEAIAINPELIEAIFNKGTTLAKQFGQYEQALKLIDQSLKINSNLFKLFPHAYFWFAYVHEHLGKLEDSITWINLGLNYYPSDPYFLQFKYRVLGKYWDHSESFKTEALAFFKHRYELKPESRSLYFILRIEKPGMDELVRIISRETPLLKTSGFGMTQLIGLDTEELLTAVEGLDAFSKFRNIYPSSRYVNHLINPYFLISLSFWEAWDLCCAIAYASAVKKFREGGLATDVTSTISMILFRLLPRLINLLVPDQEFSRTAAAELMTQLTKEYSAIIFREIGAMSGHIQVELKTTVTDPVENLDQQGHDELMSRIIKELNKKLMIWNLEE